LGGDFRGISVYRSDVIWVERGRRLPRSRSSSR